MLIYACIEIGTSIAGYQIAMSLQILAKLSTKVVIIIIIIII